MGALSRLRFNAECLTENPRAAGRGHCGDENRSRDDRAEPSARHAVFHRLSVSNRGGIYRLTSQLFCCRYWSGLDWIDRYGPRCCDQRWRSHVSRQQTAQTRDRSSEGKSLRRNSGPSCTMRKRLHQTVEGMERQTAWFRCQEVLSDAARRTACRGRKTRPARCKDTVSSDAVLLSPIGFKRGF